MSKRGGLRGIIMCGCTRKWVCGEVWGGERQTVFKKQREKNEWMKETTSACETEKVGDVEME